MATAAPTEEVSAQIPQHEFLGPDGVAPADTYRVSERDKPVKMKLEEKGIASVKPISVPTLLRFTAERIPDHPAMAVKRNNKWYKWTYGEYYEEVITAAKAFVHLGLDRYKGVGILGFNSPEWFIADQAAIFAGGISMGIYFTNSPDACRHVARDGQCNILVVENNTQLQKILQVRDQLPDLKAIIQYTGEPIENYENVYTWKQFMSFGRTDEYVDIIKERLRTVAPNKCCTLVYTSGTTGNPKGVMLSHDNLTWTCQASLKTSRLRFGQEVVVSYLPLSHVSPKMTDIYIALAGGATVYFAQPDALKGSLKETLLEVRPTAFFAVPRVWEKLADKIKEQALSVKGLQKKVGKWAKDMGARGHENIARGRSVPVGWSVADKLVFTKIKKALGLDRCSLFISGAAPLMEDTIRYFLQFDIPITEGYGSSESTGPTCVGFPWNTEVGSCGKEIKGVSTKIVDPEAGFPVVEGEVMMRGRNICMGYVDRPDATAETIDEEGWLHSGDLGTKKNGRLFITGRIKELIITAGGENIPPVEIETQVKTALPCVSECVLVGDKRRFLSMLIALKCEVDFETELPTDKLAQPARQWCIDIGAPDVYTVTQILNTRNLTVLQAVQAGIDKVNSQATSNAQKIQKWSIVPKDFSIKGGEMGNSMKVMRRCVHKKYEQTEESFYS